VQPTDGSDWRSRGSLFDRGASDYLEGRPGYPTEVYDLLREHCNLRPGSSVLEVGPGTGQATVPLLDAGAHVTAVEPGADLASALRFRTVGRDITVVVNTFEDAGVPEGSFDLLVSATAFHWVVPDIGFAKAGRALRLGGWLALWWTIWGDPDGHDPLHERLQPILMAKAPHLLDEGLAPGGYALDAPARIAEITSSGAFGDVDQHIIRWTGSHTADEARALFNTFSPWLALDEPLRSELLDDVHTIVEEQFGGRVDRPYVTVLYRAQRTSVPGEAGAQV
jgi:SAM-dependent methyltransferase